MSDSTTVPASLLPSDTFVRRHIGPSDADLRNMLASLGVDSLGALVDQAIPADIRLKGEFELRGHTSADRELGEREVLAGLKETMSKNELTRALIGVGYHDTITPPVILRNILENPGWYTQYTPYQAEISQGRLEALLNFQTMVSELSGLPVSNSSLLDEATAAAEAMTMCWGAAKKKKKVFVAADDCHPQTLNVLKTRAEAAGLELRVVSRDAIAVDADTCGVLVQYPTTYGEVEDYAALADKVHEGGALLVVSADILALTILRPPGEFGADICVGSAQRFGVPMGFGGPHAAFLSTTEKYKRQIPGRIIGVSKDAHGKRAYRMAMQTREQHIRREKATSNICTAQVLLAIMAGMYGTYHGPKGLVDIANRVRGYTQVLAKGLSDAGIKVRECARFDTVWIDVDGDARQKLIDQAVSAGFDLRIDVLSGLGISLDEKTDVAEMDKLLAALGAKGSTASLGDEANKGLVAPHARQSAPLTHEIFEQYHAEHEMLRYLYRLQQRDLSLTTSMIALGSCTMKLNATCEMLPVTWPEVGGLHPFVPPQRAQGWAEMLTQFENWLCDITGFAAMSLQPNAGSQGEYAGLLTIRAYHRANGDTDRKICLIPVSAHGTNPASAVMAGMKVVIVKCDEMGNIDVEDLRAKAEKHKDELAALMVTYPSTHGVFEASIREICTIVHDKGGQVYLDGANMNAQVGLCRPGDYGADVCHLNLHKTFCIPHGGGGPGMGPIGLVAHLAPFAPGHPLVKCGGEQAIDAVSAAPWGSSSILPISWVYIAAMGAKGLITATQVAILNANYMAKRLGEHYQLLYTGLNGRVAHEFILDLRPFKKVKNEDVAKRLMDYGFHAPTMSFPVAGTLMIEPTESESKAELDRFCDAMIAIRAEIEKVENGTWQKEDNPLVNSPHPADIVMADEWDHAYSRSEAAFPLDWVKANKFWPSVSRIDNAWGDRNLICTCPPIEAYEDAAE